jgi:predicted MFS family arabinose efflux permease
MSRTPAGDRGAVGGTVTSFVDVAIASGAIVLGGVADLGGYPAVFLVSACSAVAGLVLLQRIAGVSRVADATA